MARTNARKQLESWFWFWEALVALHDPEILSFDVVVYCFDRMKGKKPEGKP